MLRLLRDRSVLRKLGLPAQQPAGEPRASENTEHDPDALALVRVERAAMVFALGAERGRLVRQALDEGLLLRAGGARERERRGDPEVACYVGPEAAHARDGRGRGGGCAGGGEGYV